MPRAGQLEHTLRWEIAPAGGLDLYVTHLECCCLASMLYETGPACEWLGGITGWAESPMRVAIQVERDVTYRAWIVHGVGERRYSLSALLIP